MNYSSKYRLTHDSKLAEIEQSVLFKIYHHGGISINAKILQQEGIHVGDFETDSASFIGYTIYTFVSSDNIFQRIEDDKGTCKSTRHFIQGQWSEWIPKL